MLFAKFPKILAEYFPRQSLNILPRKEALLKASQQHLPSITTDWYELEPLLHWYRLIIILCNICFVHPIFRFWFLVTFGDKVMKIQKYYIIFVYILQGKMGKTEKNGKKITQLKWPKYQKPKDENMGWTKQKLRYSEKTTKVGDFFVAFSQYVSFIPYFVFWFLVFWSL